jgi:hypothetical protein
MNQPSAASQRWADALVQWAIPQELVDAAESSPYFFDPQVFIEAADQALARTSDTASDSVARDALPPHGVVLDVGVGAGAASLRLGARQVIGVDPSPVLLAAFADRATGRDIEPIAIEGSWPQVAADAPAADVVVCHHVIYNVSDLAPFVVALTAHAIHRIVIEITAVHPMAWLAPYWEALHDLPQPDRPTADDAVSVLTELGLDVRRQDWRRRIQMIGEASGEQLARIARRLCLPRARHDELRRLLSDRPPPLERNVVTLWW